MTMIQHIRISLGLTQTQMGEIVGVGQNTISRWENGVGEPCMSHIALLRAHLQSKGTRWRDSRFFETPKHKVTS